MIEAQRLRDLHTIIKGYTPGFFHETKEPFNTFSAFGKHSSKDVLSPFGIFTKRTNRPIGFGEYQIPLNVKFNNPLKVENKKELLQMLPEELKTRIQYLLEYRKNPEAFEEAFKKDWKTEAIKAKRAIGRFLDSKGYNALDIEKDWAGSGLVKNERWTDAFIVPPQSGRVKLADAVTYDDNGIRIPLGLRDNFSNPDIRYGLIPLIPLTFGNKQINKAKKGIKLIPKK